MTVPRPDAIAARWASLPGNLRGALWAMLAVFFLTGMAASIKLAGQTMGVWQILVLRSAFAMVVILPLLAREGFDKVRTRRPVTHLIRSLLGFGGITALVVALQHLDLALVTTLGFTRTLFVIVLAVLLLGETIRWRRWTATAVGFGGVIVCLQPGTEAFDSWMLVPLAMALCTAGVNVTIKRLTSTEAPVTILIWSYGVTLALSLVPAALAWRAPTLEELAIVGAMSVCTALGQGCMVLALRAGEATAVTPFEYFRLLWAVLFGFVLFGDLPTLAMLGGAAIIVASTLYIAMRGAKTGSGV
jgi:drug/metabolite transporter (DMT)-like permease